MIRNINKIIYNIKKYSFLMRQLIVRDFKVKYKRSVLGVVWSLLNPLLMMSVMAIVFSNMFKFKVDGVNYLVYLMTGIIMFNFFSEATNIAMGSVRDNFGLMNKIYIPKYIFPICKVLFVCINFFLTLIPWFIIIVLSKFGLGDIACYIGWKYIFLIYIFICLIIFTAGIGLLLSCAAAFLKDVVYIYGIVLMIWNYLTPVFYSIEILPESLKPIFMLNPLYQFLDAARQIVLFGWTPTLTKLGSIGLIAIVTFGIGSLVFKKNQDKFIYYI